MVHRRTIAIKENKDMDPIPFPLASIIAASLAAAVLALWKKSDNAEKRQLKSMAKCEEQHKQCNEQNANLQKQIGETKDMIINASKIDLQMSQEAHAKESDRAIFFAQVLRDTQHTAKLLAKELRSAKLQTPAPKDETDFVPNEYKPSNLERGAL
jgi:hypothetical protein